MITLADAFQETCTQASARTALIDHPTGETWTYGALFTEIQALAARLKSHVLPGDRIGVLVTNQIGFITGFFAIQQLSAIAVPLSTRLTAAELATIAADANLRGLVTHSDFEDVTRPLADRLAWQYTVDLDTLDDYADLPRDAETLPDHLAVLVYTSGTTGTPKGVMLSHRNLLADAEANRQVIEAVVDDVFIAAGPLFHVFGLTNVLLTALLSHATLVLVRRFNPRTVLEAIGRHQVTFLAAVPTMYQMMLSLMPDDGSASPWDLSSLRVCHSGAAPMHAVVFAQVDAAFGAPVQEGYGQSEASSIIMSNPLSGIRKPGSVGLPLPGIRAEIVDEAGNLLPANEAGELRVAGETVMLGYWRRPDATARVLKDGWLHTGDMGYRDADGYLFLSGRADDLINVAGSKVYPKDVEDTLYRHPDVAQCAVVGEASELYHRVVAAYVVLRPGATALAMDLQRLCRQSLAEYKVPRSVYFVDSIPQGPTGKILRHLLRPSDANP